MTNPYVEVKIINHKNGELYYVVPSHELSICKFNSKLNDIGTCVVTCTYNPKILESKIDLKGFLDDFLQIYINQTLFETYLIRDLSLYVDENITYITFGGFSLNHLITRRILDIDDDPEALNGFVTLADEPHVILSHLAQWHMVEPTNAARQVFNLRINVLQEVETTVGIRKGRVNLFGIFDELSKASGMDFAIKKMQGTELELQLGVFGTDKTKEANYPDRPFTVLTYSFGNLQKPSFSLDREKEKNFIYLEGEGEGSNQRMLELLGTGNLDSNYNRIEFVEKFQNAAEDYDSFTEMFTEGIARLQENRAKIEFDYTIPDNLDSYELELGDKISIYWEKTYTKVRVTKISYNITATGAITSQIEGTPYE